ncbi:hypothetical protein ACM16X_04210 [Haloarcula japonica]|uniref:hypothetical protein n=1 Tax=Haloarcula japonica TaxID=29282 RepID=UPI0039F71999
MDPEDTEFVRRKFTITKELDTELEDMAAQHYQGNVSLCLRQAIADHRQTLDGDVRLLLKRLSKTVRQIQGDIEDLQQVTEAVHEYVGDPNRSATSVQAGLSKSGSSTSRQTIRVIEDAETPLRAEDIIERVELPPRVVRRTLGRLIDQSLLSRTSDAPPRYQRIGTNSDSEEGISEGNHRR